MNYNQQKKAAKEFAARWEGKGDEKQDSQRFWFDLLQNVYGIEDPASFLRRRSEAYGRLAAAMENPKEYPRILLGAEVLYFPGISVADEVRGLILTGTPFLLVEPPMMPWSDAMLDEVEACGKTLHCIPVIAHIDRYMRILDDYALFDRVRGRKLLIQVNANFFIHHDTRAFALECLQEDRFHMIGSDCHNMDDRCPNMGDAASVIRAAGLSGAFERFNERLYQVL